MRVRVTDIQWDIDDDTDEWTKARLPKAMTFTVPPLRENEDQESLQDELVELLSNKIGFCVLSFNYRIVNRRGDITKENVSIV